MNFASLSSKFIKWKINKSGLKEKLFSFDDFQVHFYDNEIEKPVILLLNGFGASTEFQWYKLLPALGTKNRVILINLLHFGKTKPVLEENCTVDNQVNLVYTLIQRLRIKKVRIAGISYGGLIASEFAEKHEPLVSELILLNAPTKFLDLENLRELCHKSGVDTIHDFFAPSDYLGLKKQFELAYYSTPWLPSFIIKSFYDELCKPYIDQWKLMVENLLGEYENLKLKNYNYKGNTTLIWGEEDVIIPVSVGLSLNKTYTNSRLECISKCGHLPSIEQSDRVIEILEKTFYNTVYSK